MMYPIVSTVTQTITLLLRFMSFFEDAAMFQHFDADLLHTLSSSNCIDMYQKICTTITIFCGELLAEIRRSLADDVFAYLKSPGHTCALQP